MNTPTRQKCPMKMIQLYEFIHFYIKQNGINRATRLVEKILTGQFEIDDSCSLLHVAVRQYDQKIAQLALDEGADILAVNEKNETPLHLAVKVEANSMVDMFLKHMESSGIYQNMINEDKLSTFHIICSSGSPAYVEAFLQHNSKFIINDKSCELDCFTCVNKRLGFTALHYASFHYRHEILQILSDHAADSKYDNSLLYVACKYNPRCLFDVMKKYKKKDSAYLDLFKTVVMDNRVKTIKLLLNKGCDPHDFIDDLQTAFKCAMESPVSLFYKTRSFFQIQSLYLDSPDCVSLDDEDRSAIIRILRETRTEIVKLLLNCNENEAKGLYPLLFKYTDWNFEEDLLHCALVNKDGGYDSLNLTYAGGDTVLQAAAKKRNFKFIKHFLKMCDLVTDWDEKLNVDAQDDLGNTALHYVCTANVSAEQRIAQFHCIKDLLERGADIRIENEKGTSFMSVLAKKMSMASHSEMAQVANCFDKYLLPKLQIPQDDRLVFSHSWSPIAFASWYHIQKFVVAGLFNSKMNNYIMRFSRKLLRCEKYEKFFAIFKHKCSVDVQKMKSIDFNGSNNFYDLMTMNMNKLATCTKNYESINNLDKLNFDRESGERTDKTCVYEMLLKARFARGIAREKLLEQAKDCFANVINFSLPEACLSRIFDYLSDKNLRFVCEAANENF